VTARSRRSRGGVVAVAKAVWCRGLRRAFACFIGRVYAAPHGRFGYHPENVARAARLPGASRSAGQPGGSRPARPSSIAVPLVMRGCDHATYFRHGTAGPARSCAGASSTSNPFDELDERRRATAARAPDLLSIRFSIRPVVRFLAHWCRAQSPRSGLATAGALK